MVMEEDCPTEPASAAGTLRNLSAWSITIPYIHSYEDELKREKVPVFCIDVERNDRKQGEEPPSGAEIAMATPRCRPEGALIPLEVWSGLVCSRSSGGELVHLQAICGILRPGVQAHRVPR